MLGDSMIRGLRLEPDLAQALTAYAETQADAHSLATGEVIPPNVVAAARDLLRRGLGLRSNDHRSSCEREGYFRGLAEARRKMADAIASR